MLRYDRIDAPTWMTTPFVKTPEGFLRGRACVTNIGIFPYRFADGRIEYELRHPDDVFAQASMDSLKNIPLTNDHPSVMVTDENVTDYRVGSLGDDPLNGDNMYLSIGMTVEQENAIKDILGGKQELSCGYSVDVIDETGTWLGMPYTKRQKNIVYNHCSVVQNGRAGETARIRLDSGDAIMIQETAPLGDSNIENNKEGGMSKMRTIQIDSVDYEADDNVIKALKDAETRVDSLIEDSKKLVGEKDAIEAERDSMKAKLDASEKKITELEAVMVDEAEINKKVEARVALIASAKSAGVEVIADTSDADVRKAVIMAVYPDTKLDDKSDAYIMARFDCAMEDLPKQEKADASVREANAPVGSVEKKDTALEARNRMIERLSNQGKK